MSPCAVAWTTIGLLASLSGGPLATHAVGQGLAAVLHEPDGTAVGVAIVVAAGDAWESESEAGASRLAGLAVVEATRSRLDLLSAIADVECDRNHLVFTLVAPAAMWESAAEALADAIFRVPPPRNAVERARPALLRSLDAEEGSPTAEIHEALDRVLFDGHPRWTGPACGRAQSVARLSAEAVTRTARERFRPDRATAAVAGPVDEERARQLLRRVLDDADRLVPLPTPPPVVPGGRERVLRNTVTSWVSIAFRVPETTDLEAARMLAFDLSRMATPDPSRPEIHDVAAEVSSYGSGAILVVHLVTEPEAAESWIDRIRDRVASLASEPLPADAFAHLLRRYRGARLLELATPETRARDAAKQLFFGRDPVPAHRRLDALTAEALQRTAASLVEPAIAVLGPR